MNGRSIISVDVEGYFHVEAFAGMVPRASWGGYECRVERNTDRIHDLLNDCPITATFFILGWVAEPDEFREDTWLAKNTIEQAAGIEIRGDRAPSFSITRGSRGVLNVPADLGFRYDSSVRHDVYGLPGAPRGPFHVETPFGPLVEFPMAMFRPEGLPMPSYVHPYSGLAQSTPAFSFKETST